MPTSPLISASRSKSSPRWSDRSIEISKASWNLSSISASHVYKSAWFSERLTTFVRERSKDTIPMTEIDVITFGETMVLVDPEESGPLKYVSSFSKSVGGAESNVAIALAKLGHEAGVVQQTRRGPPRRIYPILCARRGRRHPDCHVRPRRADGHHVQRASRTRRKLRILLSPRLGSK